MHPLEHVQKSRVATLPASTMNSIIFEAQFFAQFVKSFWLY